MSRKKGKQPTPQIIVPLTSHLPPFVSWFRGISGISILAGFGLMRNNYLFGVAVVYLGVIFSLWTAITDPWILNHSLRLQVVILLFVLIIFDVFSIGIVWARAPILFQSYAMRKGDYPPGTVVAGITWDSHLTDLRVAITNQSDDDYDNLDIEVRPDNWTYQASLLTTLSSCELTRIDGDSLLRGAVETGGTTTFTTTRVGAGYDAHDGLGNQYSLLASGSGYRLRCGKVPSHFTIRMVFALVKLQDYLLTVPPHKPTDTWTGTIAAVPGMGAASDVKAFDKRPSPAVVHLVGKYSKNLKPFEVEDTLKVQDGN